MFSHWLARVRRWRPAAVLLATLERGRAHQGQDMAASIAYFAFFSLFPLLVVIAAVSTVFFATPEVQERLDAFLVDEFPGSEAFIRDTIAAMIDLRETASTVGLLGLVWSASRLFAALTRALNVTFESDAEPIYHSALKRIAITLAVPALVVLLIALSAALEILGHLDLTRVGLPDVFNSWLWSRGVSTALGAVSLALVYQLIPRRPPGWRAALRSGVLVSLAAEVAKFGFTLYIEHAPMLNAVYGTLTAAIVVVLWLYVTARLVLFGAELSAVLSAAHTSS